MSYYLFEHAPKSRQFYPTRVTPWRGAIGFHTTEAALDEIAPDAGAENVAAFIARRPDPGSYVGIDDTDSSVELVPWNYTTFSIGVKGYNSATYSRALACRTTDLDPDDPTTTVLFDRFAAACVRDLLDADLDPLDSAKWITGAQALAGEAGFFHHGDVQSDRSDAFSKHPRRAELEALFLVRFRLACGPVQSRKVSQRMQTIKNAEGRRHTFRVRADGAVHYRWEVHPSKGDFDPEAALGAHQLPGSPSGLGFDALVVYPETDGRLTLNATHCATDEWWWCTETTVGGDFTAWNVF